jgi:hypothetical protein
MEGADRCREEGNATLPSTTPPELLPAPAGEPASPVPELELLTGIPEIARALHRDEHSVRAMCEAGLLPAFFLGGRWYARRTTLANFFTELEAQQLARGAARGVARPAARWLDPPAENNGSKEPKPRPPRRRSARSVEAGDVGPS